MRNNIDRSSNSFFRSRGLISVGPENNMFVVICENVLQDTNTKEGKNTTNPDWWINRIWQSLLLNLRVQTPGLSAPKRMLLKHFRFNSCLLSPARETHIFLSPWVLMILSGFPICNRNRVYRYLSKHGFMYTRDFSFAVSIFVVSITRQQKHTLQVVAFEFRSVYKLRGVHERPWKMCLRAACMHTRFQRCFRSQPSIIQQACALGFIRSVLPCVLVSCLLDRECKNRSVGTAWKFTLIFLPGNFLFWAKTCFFLIKNLILCEFLLFRLVGWLVVIWYHFERCIQYHFRMVPLANNIIFI